MSPKSQVVKQSGLHGFLAQPDAPTKAGVVILPTIFGVNPFARGYAETLARAGLAAAVWDHYDGAPLPKDYEEAKARGHALTDGGMQTAIGRWVDYLLGELALSAVGVIGFCMGGRTALNVAARDRRIAACVAAYPSIEMPLPSYHAQDTLALAADIRCPVNVVQPGHDHVASPPTYAELNRILTARAAPTIWQYYPAAEHGFMHRPEPAANPAATRIASPQLIGFLNGALA